MSKPIEIISDCPECGNHMLVDTNPEIMLCSMPAQKRVHCTWPGCNFKGTVFYDDQTNKELPAYQRWKKKQNSERHT